jgi:hypothetical protein
LTSRELDDAVTLGQLRAQATLVDGRIVGRVEPRPRHPDPQDWKDLDAPGRVKLRLANGHELWVYAHDMDLLTGAGPGDLGPLPKIMDPQELAAAQARGDIVPGASPHLADRLRPDGTILSLPGSAGAAWAAEAGAAKGNQVDLVGDVSPDSRADRDDPQTGEVQQGWSSKIAAAQAAGDDALLAQIRADMERAAHPGLEIPRNNIDGAAAHHPNIHLRTGRPEKIERTPDGRYHTTMADIVTGQPRQHVSDQIVYAYGQSKAPHLEEMFGPAPSEGLLEPVYYDEARTQFVGLRDPRTGYMLRGAAAANARGAPWVLASERAAWLTAVRNAQGGMELFDGRPLSPDSHRVVDGIEIARDRIQRGQVLDDRRDYRLPGDEYPLALEGDASTWGEQIRRFMIDQVPAAPPDKVKVKSHSGGASGDPVFEVVIDGQPLGMWKAFKNHEAAQSERALLKLLTDAQLTALRTPRERGAMGVQRDGERVGESVLMDKAPGQSLEDLALALPQGDGRDDALLQFRAAMIRAAQGDAELHARFTDTTLGPEARRAARKSDADHLLGKLTRADVVRSVGGAETAVAIRDALHAQFYDAFLAADLPPSAYHGDAHLGNFKVDGWDAAQKVWRHLYTFDIGTMQYGFPRDTQLAVDQNPRGDKPAAGADLGRLLGSLESKLPEGTLTAKEQRDIREDVIAAYQLAYAKAMDNRAQAEPGLDPTLFTIDPAALQTARTWYQIEMELAAAGKDPRAVERIGRLLHLQLRPVSATTGDNHE